MHPGVRQRRDAPEDIGEPRLRVDVVELGGADQGVHRRGALAASVGAAEQPGFSSQGQGPERALSGIIREADAPVVEEAGEAVPAAEHVVGRTVPLIDRVHRFMHFWRTGDEARVNGYIDDHGLARHTLFARLQQALIEVAPTGSEERAILASLSNHIAARAGLAPSRHAALGLETPS